MHIDLIGVLLVRVTILPTPTGYVTKPQGKGWEALVKGFHETSVGRSSFHFFNYVEVRN